MRPTSIVVAGALALLAVTARSEPPADAAGLRAWLERGTFREWQRESAPHRSAGPHPETVRTYVDPVLHASLASGAKEHPAGATAVKELYRNGVLSGYAVAIKTSPRSAVGRGWYWYEVTSLAADAKPVAAGHGVPLCLGCHLAGRDFVLTPFPLK